MKYCNLIVSSLLLVTLAACSSVKIKKDFDPEYDFSTFKTYRWAAGREINPADELQKYPLVLKRVMAAVNSELEAKGMVLAPRGEEPDVVVVAHAGIKERVAVHQTGTYTGSRMMYDPWYDPWWGPHGGTTHVSHYEEATLVIDMVCWKTKELAWRGTATGVVKENLSGEKQQARLDEIAAKLFADYPPNAKQMK